MRMSCDSTYLLDQETDHGVKADELATLLDESARARRSRRWSSSASGCACTTSCIRRLQARGIGHVSFHGGVPPTSARRWCDRFRDDPDCRVFLSTDAGGAGPEPAARLGRRQHGPAVEPRGAGAAHRPRPSPRAAASRCRSSTSSPRARIEEGMLSVLAFKRSLFDGHPRWRHGRDHAGRAATQSLHEGRREGHRPDGPGPPGGTS